MPQLDEIIAMPVKQLNVLKRQFEVTLPAGTLKLPDLPEKVGELARAPTLPALTFPPLPGLMKGAEKEREYERTETSAPERVKIRMMNRVGREEIPIREAPPVRVRVT